MTALRVFEGAPLPVEAATETFLVVGKRGSGKSSTATRLAERFMTAKVPIACIDPVDVWWGLKAGADGESGGGFPVYVFGGEHADLALEPSAGTLMADTLVDHRINAVFVVRQFSNREKARFVSDFAEQLFKRNRDVLHLFCEEAHELMPQNPYAGEEEMLGRMLRLEKLGRTSGIGMTAITQRPASLNKNATTQAEILVAHRIIGPQDRAAIEEWIKYHHVAEKRAEVLASLAELKTGEAWLWAPDFPEDKPIGLCRVSVLMPETFDSRRTPKPGEKRVQPKTLVPMDLTRLGEKMAATRARSEENDPVKLKATIGSLRKEMAALQKATAPVRLEVKTIEKRILTTADRKAITRLGHQGAQIAELIGAFEARVTIWLHDAKQIASALSAASTSTAGADRGAYRPPDAVPAAVRAATPRPVVRAGGAAQSASLRSGESRVTEGITARQQRFLDAAATLTTLSTDVTRESVSAWLGIHPRGGSVGEELKALEIEGYIRVDRGAITVTDKGFSVANIISQEQAIASARDGLTPRQRRIFDLVVSIYPETITREEIARGLTSDKKPEGLHPRGGSLGEDIGRLAGRGLVTVDRGAVRARDFLFAGASA